MKKWLGSTPVLITLFVGMIAIGYSFQGLIAQIGGAPLLDMITNGDAARTRLAEMTQAQRDAHFWGTVLNDSLYPLAYGGFFAGLALRFGNGKWIWAMPALLTILVDFAENTVQALALSEIADLLALKSVLTPLKFGLFLIALAVAVFALVTATLRVLKSRKQT